MSVLPAIDEVNVFVVPLTVEESQLSQAMQILSSDERARAERFVRPELARRFAVCRAALRTILAEALDIEPQRVLFEYERWGKPRIAGAAARSGLQFNVSHSGELGLLAFAFAPVGIDVEFREQRLNAKAIASQVLSPREAVQWRRMRSVDQTAAMLQLWVCKEALLKAMGLGIAEGLKQISFELPMVDDVSISPFSIESHLQLHLDDDGSCRTNSWTDTTTWRLSFLREISDCYAAVATTRQISKRTITPWTNPWC